MNSSIYRFSLDLHSAQSQISIPVLLGDTGRKLRISLSDGGKPYVISDGCLAKLSVMRPSGTSFIEFCTIENNTTIVYSFDQNLNTAAVEGIHECDVVLYGSDGREIGSPRFSMIVSTRVLKSDEYIPTDEDKTIVDAMISAEAERNSAEAERVNAEASRVSAETERVNQERARESAFQTAMTNSESAAKNAQDVANDIAQKRDAGEFNGVSVTHSWEGAKLTFKSASGEETVDLKENLYNTVYPVGSIYMSIKPQSPASLFGGTWERIMGKFLLGADSDPYLDEYNNDPPTYNGQSEGGSADAVVVAHNHTLSRSVIAATGVVDTSFGVKFSNESAYGAISMNDISTKTNGVDGTGKNLPPYLAVYVWKRTA